jgi:hypothetical protein
MLKRPEDVLRFAADAAPGAWESYGRGDHPPREMVRAMQPFVAAGVLVPAAKREGAGFLYLVKRSRTAPKVRVRAARAARAHPAQSDQSRVLRCLIRAACRRLPCPSYAQIARRCDISERAARHRVQQLARAGRIAATYDAHTGQRVITITAGPHAGKSTMLSAILRPSTGSGPQDEREPVL